MNFWLMFAFVLLVLYVGTRFVVKFLRDLFRKN